MAGAPSPSPARLLLLLATGCLLLLAVDAARRPLSLAPADAADALLKLKAGIKDGDGALGSWSAGTSPCGDGDGDAGGGSSSSWNGVLCSKDGVHGLQLEGMGLSGTLDLRALKTLPGLRTLSFTDNEFAGPLPDIKELSGLRAVFFSGNKFSGVIPDDAFAGMGSLKKVVLSKNNFSGPIPASLADAPRLLELQLNDNKFQGKIPDLKQQELKDVNLANNELEGEIPASLKSTTPEMFAGNKKLCGPPLGAKCEPSPSPSPSPAPAPISDGQGTTPTLPAADIVASTGASSADDAKQDEGQKPTEGSTSFGVLAAFLGTLAIAGVAFVALRRRRGYKTKNFGPDPSARPSVAPKVDPQPPAKADAAAAASRATGGGPARKVEPGRLTFVRDDRGRFFELQDLLKATAEVLGAANLGVCYCATLTSGHSVVVKRFKEMNRVGREDFEEHMRRLGRLSHPNLLPLVSYYYRKEEKLLIHDYVPNRSLANLLHGGELKKAAVHWSARLKIIKGVARALSYLYDELCMLTVPHGHLKSSNILLDGRFEPLLTDYALVPVMNQSHAAQLMVAFKSPERKQFGRSSKKSDVWCLGLLILEMLTGKPPTYDPPKAAAAAPSGGSSSPKPAGPTAGNVHDLVALVGSTPEGEWLDTVVDPSLRDEEEENREEMVKLIRVGMACCETNVDSRWELKTAIDRIEELKGKERANENEEPAFYSMADDDYSNLGIN